jgi:hypothetical protein
VDTTLEKLDKMTEAEKLFQQFASKGAADPDNAVSNQQLFDAFVAARQPEIVEADVEEEISVQQPSGVTGGTLEEQMMAAESEIPVLDAYGSPIMPPPAQPKIDPSFQEKLIGAAEVLMTLASGATTGAGGMVRGTLEGLAEQILSGQFGTPEAAQMIYQKAMQRAGEATYMPRTPVGQEYVQETSEVLSQLPAMAPLVAETGAIRAGLAGAAQAARYGGRPSVQQMTGQMVRETGREAFDVLPSPVQTAGRTVAGAAQKGSDLVASGYDFSRGRGQNLKTYTRLLKSRPDSSTVAQYQLINDRVVADPLAVNAIDQGWDSAVLGSIKTSSNKDKFQMTRMLGVFEEGKIRADYAALNRPEAVLGKSMLDRVNFLINQNKSSGIEIGKIAKQKLKGQKINVDPAVGKLLQDLEEIKVKVVLGNENGFLRNPTISFDGSQLQADRSSQRLLRDVMKYLNDVDSTDALSVHELKKFLDSTLVYGKKAANPIAPKIDEILKGFRRNLNDSLNVINKDYQAANKKFSETITALDAIQDAVGKKVEFDSDRASDAFGTALRRVLSNYGTRNSIIDSIDLVETVARKYGMDINDDLIKQLVFVNEIDRMFGSVAPSSFKGQIEQAAKKGLDFARSDAANKAFMIAVGAKDLMKTKTSQKAAIEAMKKLLKRRSSQTKNDQGSTQTLTDSERFNEQ